MPPRPKTICDLYTTSLTELSAVVQENPSLRGMIAGYIAERKLRKKLARLPGVTKVTKSRDHDRKKKGDLLVTYRGHEFKIEVKSLQTNSIKQIGTKQFIGSAQCDASDRRTIRLRSGKTIDTTCLRVGEFDILAICLFGFTGKWEFAFILNRDLPRSTFKAYPPEIRRQLIKTLVGVGYPVAAPFTTEPAALMRLLLLEKRR